MPVLKKHQDPIGKAVHDYFHGIVGDSILVRTDIAEDETLSPGYFFRTFGQMPLQEQEALKRCKGKILDVGAGAGAHSVWLKEQGLEVVSIDISPLSCEVMRERGLTEVLCGNIYSLTDQKFDTILLLMNGAGVAQTLPGLTVLLDHLKQLLNPGGRILADSSDLLYLFTDENGESWIDIASDTYYGEMEYQLCYKTVKGKKFPWLFVDSDTLAAYAERSGFTVVDKVTGLHFDYLIELTLN
ncbi:MAG: class I SAM-dependent methyltransferase [Prolixibacteraceae bacterium]|jgi:SAM-dependent methyltransferase|nr:class I SAM-dependent methyltransferase [Prolixibacteraceae bacterium]